MRTLVAVLLLVVAGCSSGAGEAATTSTAATVGVPITVHALGGGVTWSGPCRVGEVRVTVADGSGETLAVETVAPSGEAPADRFGDCVTDPVVVDVPAAGVYRVAVAGAGPLGAVWSAAGEFSAVEAASGLVVTARSPGVSELAAV